MCTEGPKMNTNWDSKLRNAPELDNNSCTVDCATQEQYDRSKDTTVYVGNLPPTITWQKLRAFFGKFGYVVYAKCIVDHITNRPKGYGFVTFATTEFADRAFNACDKQLKYQGRTLKVQKASTNSRRTVQRTVLQEGHDLPNKELNEEVSVVDLASPASRLNDDSLIHIFKYLTPVERIGVERVCKQWQRCAMVAARQQKQLQLMKRLRFSDYFLHQMLQRCGVCLISLDVSHVSAKLGNNALCIIAKFCRNLEILNISGVQANNRGIDELSRKCPNLRWLNAVGCYSISETGFWLLFRNCQKLEHLDCSGNPAFIGKCLDIAGEAFTSLHASNCKKLNNEGLLRLIKRCPRMKTLKVNMCYLLTYETLSTVAKALPHLTEVDVGDLPGRYGWNELVQHVVQHFVNPGIIVKLEVYNCFLVDSDLKFICSSCPLLAELDISLNKLTDDSVGQLSTLKHLEYLSACRLSITNASLMGVAMQGKLRRLRVQACKELSDNLMKIIAKNCIHLEEVDVSGIRHLSTKTLRAFHENSLQRVDGSKLLFYIANNNFDEEIVRELSKSPTLSIIKMHRPLYLARLTWEGQAVDDNLLLGYQNLELEDARMFYPMYPLMQWAGLQLEQAILDPGDLFDYDDDSDEFDDFDDLLVDVYLDNDDPLAEEWWHLS